MKIENCKLKIATKYKAFTLTELLLVIAIIGIMTTVGLVSMNSHKSKTKLEAAQREVASAIKLTQSYALQGRVANDGSGNMVTPCGFGLRFDPADTTHTKYEIFYNNWTTGGWYGYTNCADMNKDLRARQWQPGTPHSQTMEFYQLNNGVTLSAPDIYAGSSPPNTTEFYFTIPDGGIYDNTGSVYSAPTTLIFSLPGTGDTKTITIDSGGSITESP